MYNAGKVVFGLIVFVALVTFPVWYNAGWGEAGPAPTLEYPAADKYGTACVGSKDFMRDSHMDLLNEWRDRVVRRGERVHQIDAQHEVVMSLSNTCMHCHWNKDQFCNRCHDYLGVKPYCWTCHIEPEGSL